MKLSKPVLSGIAVAAIALVIGVALYAASPFLALSAIRSAAESGNRSKLESLIDFPRVRDTLKSDLKVMFTEEMRKDASAPSDGFAAGMEGLAIGMVSVMVDGIVDQMVTPATLEKSVKGQPVTLEMMGESAKPLENMFPKDGAGDRFEVKRGYISLNQFRVSLENRRSRDGVDIEMQRQGLFGWRVVRLTPNFDMENLSKDNTPSSAGEGKAPTVQHETDRIADPILQVPSPEPTAQQETASFDCRRASTSVERTICGSAGLSRLDRQIAQAYDEQLGIPGSQIEVDQLVRRQREWLKERNICRDEACLVLVMGERLEELPEL